MDHEWLQLPDPVIPKLSSKRLQELHSLLKPLVFNYDTRSVHLIPECHLSDVSYAWAEQFNEKVKFTELLVIDSFHSCGYYGLFKPSISECLSVIDPVYSPEYTAYWINNDQKVGIYHSGGFHRARLSLGTYEKV